MKKFEQVHVVRDPKCSCSGGVFPSVHVGEGSQVSKFAQIQVVVGLRSQCDM